MDNPTTSPVDGDFITTATFCGLLGLSAPRLWSLRSSDPECPEPTYINPKCAVWPREEAERYARTRTVKRRGPVATSKRTAN